MPRDPHPRSYKADLKGYRVHPESPRYREHAIKTWRTSAKGAVRGLDRTKATARVNAAVMPEAFKPHTQDWHDDVAARTPVRAAVRAAVKAGQIKPEDAPHWAR